MNGGLWDYIGIVPLVLIILLFIIQIVTICLLVNLRMKYNRMRKNYNSFMKGKDGKSMEKSVLDRFRAFDELESIVKENSADIDNIYMKIKRNYQKAGIVRYDAFHEMGGNLSFALTMLDEDDNGWVLNAMHSREGCYTYIKEVVKGESFIELAEEEKESLERAVYQEQYDLKRSIDD